MKYTGSNSKSQDMTLNIINNLLAQSTNINRKPICPQLIHDEPTRLLVILILLPLSLLITYRILRSFNE